jgi:thiopeptide-type bacteriocin biosynthesis protein
VLARLPKVPAAQPFREKLTAALSACATWDTATEMAEPTAAMRDMLMQGEVQVDALMELGGSTIASSVAADAARAAEMLLQIGPSANATATLSSYLQEFVARYGPEAEVPLLRLLHPDTGLGDPYARRRPTPTADRRGRRNRTLLELATRGLTEGGTVELDSSVLAALASEAGGNVSTPRSLDLSIMVAAVSSAALDRGEYLVAVGPNVGANAAGRILGRFADALEGSGLAALSSIASREESLDPDVCLAELGYLPVTSRTANVILHPAFRRFELVLDWVNGDPAQLIPPRELVVGVQDNRFYLRWLRTGQEVEVTVGHMVNPSRAPSLPRFLADVGRQHIRQLFGFDWGPASHWPHLPRITQDRLVLSLERWQLNAPDWPHDPSQFASYLARWRAQWHAPRLISLAAGDNRIPLDLNDPDQADQLRRALTQSRTGVVVLAEQFPRPEDAWLTGPGGRYLSELVVPLIRRRQPPRTTISQVQQPAPPMSRHETTAPLERAGRDWLFLKLYSPAESHDSLLTGLVADLIANALRDQLIDAWFFIRYTDTDPHLRVRMHGQPTTLATRLLPALITQLHSATRDGLLAKVTLDTYEREISRYGGPAGIEIAEQLFELDSNLAVELLRVLDHPRKPEADTPEIDRLHLAALSSTTLLAGLGLDAAHAHDLLVSQLPRPIPGGREYRTHSRALQTLFMNQRDRMLRSDLNAPLERYRQQLEPLANQLGELQQDWQLTQSPSSLYRSYLHMHINRLVIIGDRRAEMIALALAARTLRSLTRRPSPPGDPLGR